MRLQKNWIAVAALATSLLTACGGGDDAYIPGTAAPAGAPTTAGSFTAVVSFGDSLSDVGAYAPATSLMGNGMAPFFGGKFTTNDGTNGTVWVENLATALGLVVTPAEVGFAGTSVACPAAANPALANTCTAYGQGGARVTDPNGIGKDGGALTVPVKTQIANHLARFGSFKATDLIFVYGGSNDVFVQFGGVGAAAAQAQADAMAGLITSAEATVRVQQAALTAEVGMQQAAREMAGYIKDEILAKGGVYVAVMGLSDIADTPFGNSLPATLRPVLSSLSNTFNFWLREGLNGQPVQWIDTWAIFKNSYNNPAAFGFTNNTVPACDAAKISAITGGAVTDGSSLFCSSTAGAPYNGLRDGASATTWQFADSVHPTTGGHKAMSDAFLAELQGFGWVP
jgi:phospholipase/lecithinase/hemolysin